MTDDKKTVSEKNQNNSISENKIDNKEQVVNTPPKKPQKATTKKKVSVKKDSSDSKEKDSSEKLTVKKDKLSKLKKSWQPFFPDIRFIIKSAGVAFLSCVLLHILVGNIFGLSSVLFSGGSIPLSGGFFSNLGLGIIGIGFLAIAILTYLVGFALYIIAHFIVNYLFSLYDLKDTPKDFFSSTGSFLSIFKFNKGPQDIFIPKLFVVYIIALKLLPGVKVIGKEDFIEKKWIRVLTLVIFIVTPIIYFR